MSSWKAFDCWALERRTFSCEFLTYSASPEFSWSNFWIFFLRASLSWSFTDILYLYSFISLMIFWFCWAESRRFSWAYLTSPSSPLFYPTSLWILYWRLLIVTPIEFSSWICFERFPISWFFLYKTPLSLSISWDKSAIFDSYSPARLLASPSYLIFFLAS